MPFRRVDALNETMAPVCRPARARAFARISLAAALLMAACDASEPAPPAQVASTPIATPEGFENLTEENTARIRAALSRVQDGSGSATILFVGDSITAGSGTGSDRFYRDAARRNYPSQLAALVEDQMDIPVSRDGFLGHNNIHGTYPDYNSRVSSVGAFKPTGSNPSKTSLGGAMFEPAGQGAFAFRPDMPADRFQIRLAANSGPASLQYRIDDGNWQTSDAVSGYGSIDITLPSPARPTISFQPSEDTRALVHGILTQNTQQPRLNIVAAGFAGSTASRSWTVDAHPWSPLTRLAAEPADLKVIALGTNDLNKNVSVDQFAAAIERIVEAAKQQSDVLLLAPPTLDEGSDARAPSRQLEFRDALKAIALKHGVAMGDNRQWFGGSYEAAMEDDLMKDSLHPSFAGAERQAQYLLQYLLAVMQADFLEKSRK